MSSDSSAAQAAAPHLAGAEERSPIVVETPPHPGNGFVRQMIDALTCLAVAVIMFRAFGLEGYIISTGSMAPCLLGYHKQIKCPDCNFEFAYGIAFDREVTTSSLIRCPNCSQAAIDVTEVPRNDGDQLLVSKHAFSFRDPRRWEVVVFLNPANPLQPYVKRLVGQPGEAVQIIDGDVHINGQIQRKSLVTQRSMRINVFDHDFPATEQDWLPRWIPDNGWGSHERAFLRGGKADDALAWVRYMHWPRSGLDAPKRGTTDYRPTSITDVYGYNRIFGMDEETPVRDLALALQVDLPRQGRFAVTLATDDQVALCELNLDRAEARLWLVAANDVDRALSGLIAPLSTARLSDAWLGQQVELELSNFDRQLLLAINGETLLTRNFETETATSNRDLESSERSRRTNRARTISPERRDITTTRRHPEEFEEAMPLPPTSGAVRAEIAVAGYSNVDDLNAEHAKDDAGPLDLKPATPDDEHAELGTIARQKSTPRRSTSSPATFAATSEAFRVQRIRLFRDVHYLSEPGQHGVDRPHQLGDDEFFFLGDNSPVSLDSRGWQDPAVPRHLIVGKPIVVHLPSTPQRIRFGGSLRYVRLPDVQRMRWIR